MASAYPAVAPANASALGERPTCQVAGCGGRQPAHEGGGGVAAAPTLSVRTSVKVSYPNVENVVNDPSSPIPTAVVVAAPPLEWAGPVSTAASRRTRPG